jgi:hypothetical protein
MEAVSVQPGKNTGLANVHCGTVLLRQALGRPALFEPLLRLCDSFAQRSGP